MEACETSGFMHNTFAGMHAVSIVNWPSALTLSCNTRYFSKSKLVHSIINVDEEGEAICCAEAKFTTQEKKATSQRCLFIAFRVLFQRVLGPLTVKAANMFQKFYKNTHQLSIMTKVITLRCLVLFPQHVVERLRTTLCLQLRTH